MKNPVTWTWRDLCRRMGISYGGQTVIKHLKAAIRSVHGIVLHTQSALYSRAESQPLPDQERGHHLYADYMFVNDPLPAGGRADDNAVWFADWYLQNLNALYTAPVDYELWRTLDARSPIASRLYELLLLNFHSGTPIFRINYPNLVQFLPIHAEQFVSHAQRQLAGAFQILTQEKVIETAIWTESKDGIPQLQFFRGARLSLAPPIPRQQSALVGDELTEAVEVKELRNLKPPEHALVSEFYRLWTGSAGSNPTAKELALAREMIATHGLVDSKALIPHIVDRLKSKWPDAKTFVAAERYLDDAVQEHEAERDRRKVRQDTHTRGTLQPSGQQEFIAAWKPRWDALSGQERETIERTLIAQNPLLKRGSAIFEMLCLQVLAHRDNSNR